MYTTQMDAARQHIITEEMKAVAAYEPVDRCRTAGDPGKQTSYMPEILWNRKHAEDKNQCESGDEQRLS